MTDKPFHIYEDSVVIHNEDRSFMFDISADLYCIGIADGHGGSSAADTCKRDIVRILKTHLQLDKEITESIIDTFYELHSLCQTLECKSGCTLTVVVIHKQSMEYVCANVGDSLALHITPSSYMWITTSHRLQDNVTEREILKEHISFIADPARNTSIGPPRLFPGGISCSRSIGDADCPFVSCRPSVYHGTLKKDDIICIATDGVWDVISYCKVIKTLRETSNPGHIIRNIQKKVVQDDASLILISTQKIRTTMFDKILFYRTTNSSSNSSISEDEMSLPLVVKVPLTKS